MYIFRFSDNRIKKEDLNLIIKTLTYQKLNYTSEKGLFIILEGNDLKNCEEELNEINKLCSKQKNPKTRIPKNVMK